MDYTKNPSRTSDAIAHQKRTTEAVDEGQTTHTATDRQNIPTKKQIEDYIQKEEERYDQIATNQENTHSLDRLARKVGEWEKSIDGKVKD